MMASVRSWSTQRCATFPKYASADEMDIHFVSCLDVSQCQSPSTRWFAAQQPHVVGSTFGLGPDVGSFCSLPESSAHLTSFFDVGIATIALQPDFCNATAKKGIRIKNHAIASRPAESKGKATRKEVKIDDVDIDEKHEKVSATSVGLAARATVRRREQRQRAAVLAKQLRRENKEEVIAAVAGSSVAHGSAKKCGLAESPSRYPELQHLLDVGDGSAIATVVSSMRKSVRRATFDREGCRIVQQIFEMADRSQRLTIASEIRGCVRSAMTSPYGNYVIQKLIETLAPSDASFIPEEIRGVGRDMCCHRFGCRIMCRLMENSTSHQATVALFDEILSEAGAVCRHGFGHYVLESLMEHGLPAHKQTVVHAMAAELPENSTSPAALSLMEKVFMHGASSEQKYLADALAGDPAVLIRLANDSVGSRVIGSLVALQNENSSTACRILQNAWPQVSGSRRICSILKETQATS